jgi:lysophospholipase L1-like esterase
MTTVDRELGDERLLEVRGDLARVAARLRRAAGTIAYFGASVTAQRDGYRPRLAAALQAATGHEHRSINAGIGGVGSISGLFLMDRLVLPHRPDLCLVEFSVADRLGWTPPELLEPVLEAIICRLRSQGCEPCFVHLHRADRADAGAMDTYDRIARHHSVSAIDVDAQWSRWRDAGTCDVDELLRDVVHTTPRGADMVADALLPALTGDRGAARSETSRAALLHGARFHRARTVPAHADCLRGPGRPQRGRFRLTYEYLAIGTGNRVECRFDGELVGLVIVVGPASGVIRVRGPGSSTDISTWDPTCFYDRLSTTVFKRPWPAGTPVTIEPLDLAVDYSDAEQPIPDAPKQLKLIGFMVST